MSPGRAQDGSGPLPLADRIWLGVALAMIALGALIQVQSLNLWLARGGASWAQADWLINLAAGPVRRGPFGSALLVVAQAAGVPVLTLLGLVQGLMVALLYGLTIWLVAIQRHRVAALAVFSAAFFVFVVGSFPASGLRKEIFGLVGLLLLAVPGGGAGRLALSGGLVLAGAIGHELGTLFLPAWLIAALWLRPGARASGPARAVIAVTALGIAAAAAYAVRFSAVADSAPICDAIRAAGPVAPDFCDGAIAWLARGDSANAQVAAAFRGAGGHLALFALAAALAVLPLVRLLHLCRVRARDALLLAAAVAPFVLLYPLGYDWGRWVMIQYSIAAILTLGLMAHGRLVPGAGVRGAELAGWLVLAAATGLNLSVMLMPLSFVGVAVVVLAGH